MKKYFDSPRKIIGWIVAVLGLALCIASYFMEALPVVESVGIGGTMIGAGAGLVSDKVAKFAGILVGLLTKIANRKSKDDKPDGE